MAVRRKTRGAKGKRLPGWVVLLVGLALGAGAVVVTQLILKRGGAGDGLAGLFAARPMEKPAPKKTQELPPPAKPKFDFYTVLPETETVLPDRRAKTAKPVRPEEGVSYILQAGAFASFQDADQLKARLALNGLVAHIQKVTIEGRGEYHRVRLGPYRHIEELDGADQQLRKLGVPAIRLRVKTGAG